MAKVKNLEPYINKQDEKFWADFFRSVKDIDVTIENQRIQLDDDDAQVSFDLNMSFFVKTTKKTEKNVVPKKWGLKLTDGTWDLVYR